MATKRKNYIKYGMGFLLVVLLFSLLMGYFITSSPKEKQPTKMPEMTTEVKDEFQEELEKFAQKNHLELSAWPEEYLEHARQNPEITEFVFQYPLKKDETFNISLSELKNTKKIPLLLQWDERWGYKEYAGNLMGFSGCGPTCLSMVSIYLLHNPKYTPAYIAEFSEKNGYSTDRQGSAWTLISEGGKKLGLDVVEIPLHKQRIIQNLETGNPIICIMGPGNFTTTGHFIVLTGIQDGKLCVNDPNSPKRSQMLWDYDEIEGQIRNLWVCRAAKK